MPTYEYACKDCGERLEAVQSFSDDPLTECPACHGTLRKVFSPVGIAFKGQGFYKTDNRSSPKSGDSKSEPKADTKSDSKSDGSSSKESKSSKSSESSSSGTKSEAKSA